MNKSIKCNFPNSIQRRKVARSRYFQEKIEKLLNNLLCHTAVDHSVDETPCFSDSLEVYEPTNTAEIASVLANTGKTCALDPLPTKQLKDNIDSILPIVTCVINASLVNAVMHGLLKQVIVRPLLKKPSIDKDIYPKSSRKLLPEGSSVIFPISECRIVSNQLTGTIVQLKLHCYVLQMPLSRDG